MAKWSLIFATVLVLCGTFVSWEKGWLEPPEIPAQTQVKQTVDYCAQLTGYDDGASDDERLAMAVAAVNLAAALGQSTCDVYTHFRTLLAPSSKTVLSWYRETPVMYSISKLSADRLAAFNATGLRLAAYLKDPTEDLKKFPWLTCVQYYIRSTWPGATPWRDFSLREKAELVWVSPTVHMNRQAEFFCPK